MNCIFIDISSITKTTKISLSADAWNFMDPIQLNKFGYCQVMTSERMKNHFGCSKPKEPFDCIRASYWWLWIILGTVGAICIGLGIWGILELTGSLDKPTVT